MRASTGAAMSFAVFSQPSRENGQSATPHASTAAAAMRISSKVSAWSLRYVIAPANFSRGRPRSSAIMTPTALMATSGLPPGSANVPVLAS